MKNQSQKIDRSAEVLVRPFKKSEAGLIIAGGVQHLHSTALGVKDPLYIQTGEIITKGISSAYSWQRAEQNRMTLKNSDERKKGMDTILEKLGIVKGQGLGEKVVLVLEELISNAFFHAYQKNGKPKYPRLSKAILSKGEEIEVVYGNQQQGIYLSVEDQGGNFHFERFQNVFQRCYGKNEQIIEKKEGGAGLGLYMVFETATHIRVDVTPSIKTKVQVWIADPRQHDPTRFSFNFFSWSKK